MRNHYKNVYVILVNFPALGYTLYYLEEVSVEEASMTAPQLQDTAYAPYKHGLRNGQKVT